MIENMAIRICGHLCMMGEAVKYETKDGKGGVGRILNIPSDGAICVAQTPKHRRLVYVDRIAAIQEM